MSVCFNNVIYNDKDLVCQSRKLNIPIKPCEIQTIEQTMIDKISEKYMRKTDSEIGHIVKLDGIRIIDNTIGEEGNIELTTMVNFTGIKPVEGLIYKAKIGTLLQDGCITTNPHFQSIVIGGILDDYHYKFDKCSCLFINGSDIVAIVDKVVFRRGKFTCLCEHVCQPNF